MKRLGAKVVGLGKKKKKKKMGGGKIWNKNWFGQLKGLLWQPLKPLL